MFPMFSMLTFANYCSMKDKIEADENVIRFADSWWKIKVLNKFIFVHFTCQRSVPSIGGLWVSDDNVLWHHNYSVTEGSWSHYLYNYRCTTAPPSDSHPSQRQRRRFPSLAQSAPQSLETVLMRECDGRVNSFTVTLKNDQIYGTHCCALSLDWSLGRHLVSWFSGQLEASVVWVRVNS